MKIRQLGEAAPVPCVASNLDFEDRWVHLRKSNTEPILRIYAEAATKKEANELAERFKGCLVERD